MARYFTDEHEWIDLEGDTATVGITDFAQGQLGDIVFVELPEVGTMVEKGKDAAVVESVKAASDVYAPLSGEVVEVNDGLEDDPALVNSSPEEDGWFFKMTVSDKSELEGLMDDKAYKSIFRPVIGKIMEMFAPGAVVLQCGADSLSGDRLGCFNLSVNGHADCVRYVRSFGVPMLVLGGGGYTLRNVPRCWTYETSVLTGEEVKDELPFNDDFEYFGPDYRLNLPVSNMENLNSPEYLETTKNQLLDILSDVEPVPSTQIQTGQVDSQLNPRGVNMEVDRPGPEEGNPDRRVTSEDTGRREHSAELAG